MTERDPNELAEALRNMAQQPAAPDDQVDVRHDESRADIDEHVDPAIVEERMAEHLAPLKPPPRIERPADPTVGARSVRPPAPGTRAIEPIEPAAPKPALRPATPLDRPAEPPSPQPPTADDPPSAAPVAPAVPTPPMEQSAPVPATDGSSSAEAVPTGLDEIVDADDDVIDMPAPVGQTLGTPVWVDRPASARDRRIKSMFFQRTLIPILLTLGLLVPALAVWLMKLPEESNLRAVGQKLSIGLIAAGVVFLLLAIVNMYVVHTNLRRQAELDSAATDQAGTRASAGSVR